MLTLLVVLSSAPASACSCADDLSLGLGFPAGAGAPTNTKIHLPVQMEREASLDRDSLTVSLFGPDRTVTLSSATEYDLFGGKLLVFDPGTLQPSTEYEIRAEYAGEPETDPVDWSFVTATTTDLEPPDAPELTSATLTVGRPPSDHDSCAETPISMDITLDVPASFGGGFVITDGIATRVDRGGVIELGWGRSQFCDPWFFDPSDEISGQLYDLAGNRSAAADPIDLAEDRWTEPEEPAPDTDSDEEEPEASTCGGCVSAPSSAGLGVLLFAMIGGLRRRR